MKAITRVGFCAQLLPCCSEAWLARLLVLALGQLSTAICKCITLCLLHLIVLLKQLVLLLRWVGVACKQFLEFTAMFADTVVSGEPVQQDCGGQGLLVVTSRFITGWARRYAVGSRQFFFGEMA